jgi:hypothetical protein
VGVGQRCSASEVVIGLEKQREREEVRESAWQYAMVGLNVFSIQPISLFSPAR